MNAEGTSTGSDSVPLDSAGKAVNPGTSGPAIQKPESRSSKALSSAVAPGAGPVLVADAGAMSSNPLPLQPSSTIKGDAATAALSWLTSMLPDVISSKVSRPNPTAGGSQTFGAKAPGDNEPLSKDAASAATHAEPAKVLAASPSGRSPKAESTSPKGADAKPKDDGTPASSAAPASARSGNVAAGDQSGIQGVAQSAENSAFSLLARSATVGAGAIPPVLATPAKSAPMVATPSAKPDSAAPNLSVARVQVPAALTTQAAAKDANAAKQSATQSSASGTSAAPVAKSAGGAPADTKNGGSQDSQPKPSGSPQPSSSGSSTQAGASASASNAAQVAANGFPAAISQQTATGGPQLPAGAPTQAGAPPMNSGEKIATAMETPINLPQTPVNGASLLQTPARAEMRVAVQTDSLGTMQLHAVLESGKLGASISVVGHEAHTLLSNELPALQQVLTDQNLHIDHLRVINSPMSSGAGAGDGRQFQSGEYGRPAGRDTRWYSPVTAPIANSDEVTAPAGARRLSVRA